MTQSFDERGHRSTEDTRRAQRPAHHGSVTLDLSEFNVTERDFSCDVLVDDVGRPERIQISVPMTPSLITDLPQQPGFMKDSEVMVRLDDGTSVQATLALFVGWSGALASRMSVSFLIARSVWHQHPVTGNVTHWRFPLANVRLSCYDTGTKTSTGTGFKWVRDTVTFAVGGRQWTLTTLLGEKGWDNSLDVTKPLLTAVLRTNWQDGDTSDALQEEATNIEALLRLALCKPVTWIACERVLDDQVAESDQPGRWLAPFGTSWAPINANFLPGQLRAFIETAYPVLEARRAWLLHSITLYVVASLSSHLEVRMALQNTLLDRMASAVLADDEGAEIDEQLPERLNKDFRKRLHALLQELSPQWSLDRTSLVFGNIRDWNAGPSFPGAVERAAVRLCLWPPQKRQLAKRHKLIHLGEYDASDGSTIFDYWQKIECLVTLMLLRMFDYAGPFYHSALGSNDRLLQDMMLGGAQLPPYEVQKIDSMGRHRCTQVAAHLHWLGRGSPRGDDWTDWLAAEAAISRLLPPEGA